jgi:hypothetical protein
MPRCMTVDPHLFLYAYIYTHMYMCVVACERWAHLLATVQIPPPVFCVACLLLSSDPGQQGLRVWSTSRIHLMKLIYNRLRLSGNYVYHLF